MGKKLAIKGHPTRGKEVIELLKMMGGKNSRDAVGKNDATYYFIDDSGIIDYSIFIDEDDDYVVFTFEEFLEKYPFKVGDKVHIPEYESVVDICGMRWDPLCNYMEYMVYRNDDEEWYTAKELLEYNGNFLEDKHCNEKQVNGMKNVLAELLDHIKNTSKEELEKEFNELEEWSNIGPTVEEFMDFCNKVNKKPKYPTTYNKCYDILNCFNFTDVEQYNFENDWSLTIKDKNYGNLMNTFVKLLICRDAYWKIAGEEMGLDKPWEPDLENEELYCIQNYNKQIIKSKTNTAFNKILIFPSEEMRNTFYENFKDLIESCKELL